MLFHSENEKQKVPIIIFLIPHDLKIYFTNHRHPYLKKILKFNVTMQIILTVKASWSLKTRPGSQFTNVFIWFVANNIQIPCILTPVFYAV